MSTSEPDFDPSDYEGLEKASTTIHNAELRKLRRQAKEADELKSRLAEIERRQIFVEAGIPTTGLGSYFIKGYDGPLEVEAIRSRAVQDGLIPGSPANPSEVAGHQAAAAVASGATPPSVAPDYAARLAELGKKQFAPADDQGRAAHVQEIIALTKEAGAQIPIYPGQ